MLDETLAHAAKRQGVPLEEFVPLLAPLAAVHFGPEVRTEVSVDEDRLKLFAAFSVKPESGPGLISLREAQRHFGAGVELDDELVFELFFTPNQEAEARAQDLEYLDVTGVSCVGCGFWPVARHAIESRLGVSHPLRAVTQRAFTCAIDFDPRFVLRRRPDHRLVLKELVEARAGGEVEPRARGRRDLVAGTVVEVTRRVVTPEEVRAGLDAHPDLVERVCEAAPALRRELTTLLDRLRNPRVLGAHVAGELEGRFLP